MLVDILNYPKGPKKKTLINIEVGSRPILAAKDSALLS